MSSAYAKILVLVHYLCLFVGSHADTNLGVSDFQCPSGTSISPAERCDQYYTCYNTQPTYLWQCRDDLLFDLIYNGCNWPEYVNCGDRIRPNSTTTVSPVTQPTTRPSGNRCEDGFYPAQTAYCSPNFLACLDGGYYNMYCPINGLFSPSSLKCVLPTHSECAATSTTTATPLPTTPVLTTTPAGFVCTGDGFFPRPGLAYCSATYYQCAGGIAYMATCPGSSFFDPSTLKCTSSPVGCTIDPSSTSTTKTTQPITSTEPLTTPTTTPVTTPTSTPTMTTPRPGSFQCPADGFYPIPGLTYCSPNYYQCLNGIAFTSLCPGGSVFDPAISKCTSAGCSLDQTTITPATNSSTPAGTVTAVSTVPTTTTPTRATSSPTNSTVTQVSTTPAPSFYCPGDGSFPGPTCNQFWTCYNQIAYLFTCPSSLVFNPETLNCDWPYNVPSCNNQQG